MPSWSLDIFYQLPPFTMSLWSIASSLFRLRAWQSFSTTSLQVFFGLPLDLGLSTSYSMHFFTKSSSFRSTWNTNAAYSAVIPMLCHLYLISLSAAYMEICLSLTPEIHLTILISARWSPPHFSFLTGQVSLPCSILLRTQLSNYMTTSI